MIWDSKWMLASGIMLVLFLGVDFSLIWNISESKRIIAIHPLKVITCFHGRYDLLNLEAILYWANTSKSFLRLFSNASKYFGHHPFSTYAKFSGNLTFVTPNLTFVTPIIPTHKHTRVYQWVRSVSFSERCFVKTC